MTDTARLRDLATRLAAYEQPPPWDQPEDSAVRAFRAALDPQTVLALLDRIDALEAVAAAARGVVGRCDGYEAELRAKGAWDADAADVLIASGTSAILRRALAALDAAEPPR